MLVKYKKNLKEVLLQKKKKDESGQTTSAKVIVFLGREPRVSLIGGLLNQVSVDGLLDDRGVTALAGLHFVRTREQMRKSLKKKDD